MRQQCKSTKCELNPPNIKNTYADGDLVLLVVISQVGEDAGSAGDVVDVGRAEQLCQAGHQVVDVLCLGAGVRKSEPENFASYHDIITMVPT